MGRWEDGKMGRWEDGRWKMGRWEDGKMDGLFRAPGAWESAVFLKGSAISGGPILKIFRCAAHSLFRAPLGPRRARGAAAASAKVEFLLQTGLLIRTSDFLRIRKKPENPIFHERVYGPKWPNSDLALR